MEVRICGVVLPGQWWQLQKLGLVLLMANVPVTYGVNNTALGDRQVGAHSKALCWSHWSKEENGTKEKYRKALPAEVVVMRYQSPAQRRTEPWAAAWSRRFFCHTAVVTHSLKRLCPEKTHCSGMGKHFFRLCSLNHFDLLLVALSDVAH